MTLRIGLTGGIGSGKSTAAQIFEVLGIPVYYADAAAKRLMNENTALKKEIISLFGDDAYVNGKLNRPFISSIVFKDAEKREALNSLVHPEIKLDGEKWMLEQATTYAIHEAALIFEAGVNERLDYVIGVSSPLELRLQRVMQRDNTSRDDTLKRIESQMPEEEKMKKCDFILYNNEKELLIPQVIDLHKRLLAFSK